MKVIVDHPHKCKMIAKAPHMGPGREVWIGKLLEPVPEWPEETHCLHIVTPVKSIVFLQNTADFIQYQVICEAVTGKISPSWMESVKKHALNLAGTEINKEIK